eukprot:CAMPEP_0206209720 /NCGR_PEP_ID=MMETSP0166-20121206/17075_1 /ASSEMBLY_ACC=CAM_ASM_000260 /TAXON_ID=95228 /ORGANISM="Vannella robusta, Strain DIVA3 518/3/11/1/6" /LENGTH=79 /DNA_ID=CAMNT_0053631167 /DNA_START=416 /DNA_END=651 /DNA_ORIENTATION=-
MAPELPLVLWDCSFPDDIEFSYDTNVIQRVCDNLTLQWKDVVIKGAIMRHMLDTLQTHAPSQATNTRKRKYTALLDLPV